MGKNYYKGTKKFGTQGGYWTKSDSFKSGAEMQKILCEDILTKSYDRDVWKQKILDEKSKVFNFNLPDDEIYMYKGISKELTEYGKPMIDTSTGHQKKNKDGSLRFAPIPSHIKLAKYMESRGDEIMVGDVVEYMIFDSYGSQIAIDRMLFNELKSRLDDLEKFIGFIDDNEYLKEPIYAIITEIFEAYVKKTKEKNIVPKNPIKWYVENIGNIKKILNRRSFFPDFVKAYDCEFYWDRIESPLKEILEVVEKEQTYIFFSECWAMSEKQLETAKENIISYFNNKKWLEGVVFQK